MIRHLHPTDSPALLPFRQRSGPDEVCSLPQALKGGERSFPLVKYTSVALSPRAWQNCWVQTRRALVQAVLRAGPRSGELAWEFSELYLARNSRYVALDVFEQLAFLAGNSGARRVFMRLPADSDLFDAARAAGYLPAYTETVFSTGSAKRVLSEIRDRPDGTALRQLDDQDLHARYRLFCATVPIDARTKVGQTFDEWNSAHEFPGRKKRMWGVFNSRSGALDAHVAHSDVSGGRYFSISAQRNVAHSAEGLIAAGLSDAGDRPAFTIVPSFDRSLEEPLISLGFDQGASYDVLIKTLAVPVTRTARGLVVAGR